MDSKFKDPNLNGCQAIFDTNLNMWKKGNRKKWLKKGIRQISPHLNPMAQKIIWHIHKNSEDSGLNNSWENCETILP